jgi:hypothetical protein
MAGMQSTSIITAASRKYPPEKLLFFHQKINRTGRISTACSLKEKAQPSRIIAAP